MSSLKILPDIYSVGVVDWDVRNFHGHTYTTKRGTTYNAYLILDEKTVLLDTVYGPFTDELIENIKQVVPPEKISYIVVNHIEIDHSGALSEILRLCPKAKVFGTAKSKEGLLRHYHADWDFGIVKTGDKLKLGKRTLSFIEAPMIHWPDSMFTYSMEDALLFPNDAFGQHYATSERFDDQVSACELLDEAEKYYANILWPFSPLILKKIQDIQKMGLAIKMIAPSHGIIWRKEPERIINAYLAWAKNETAPKVVIVYETMWGATREMARYIARGISDTGISVKLFDIAQSDRTEVIKEMLGAKGFVIGSSTHDNGMLTTISSFLEFLKGLKPVNRQAFAFGSYGWAGGAVKDIEEILTETGVKIACPGLSFKYIPDKDELNNCYKYGKDFANMLK